MSSGIDGMFMETMSKFFFSFFFSKSMAFSGDFIGGWILDDSEDT